ncbi:MAG TPA: RNA polymerase sigma-70 factor [Balneolaceae bacterium]
MGSDGHEDRVFLQRLKVGDEKSFRSIYIKYHKQLYSIALKYLRSEQLAEDAVHDVFLKLWNNKKKLDNSGSLRGFLFTAVNNHVLNMINSNKRKLKKHVQLSYEKKMDNLEGDNNIVSLLEYRKLYQLAIEQLPDKRREVFKLKIDDGLTNEEVAEFLQISVNTVKSQYYKASQSIRESVNKNISVKSTGT